MSTSSRRHAPSTTNGSVNGSTATTCTAGAAPTVISSSSSFTATSTTSSRRRRHRRQRPKKAATSAISCAGCGTSSVTCDMNFQLTPLCQHKHPLLCRLCTTRRIRQHIDYEESPSLLCMIKSCRVPLTGCDVLTVTGCHELAQRYDVLSTSFYFCSICKTDLSPEDFKFKGKRCNHPPTTCDGCILRHLQACAPTLPFKNAPCPHAGCKEELTARDLKRMVMKLNRNPNTNSEEFVECLVALLRRPRCMACNEEKDEEFTLRKATKKCGHGKLTCRLCLTKHIRHCIYGKQSTEIECLVQGCHMKLTVADVAVHTDARTSMALQKLLLSKRVDEQTRRKKELRLEVERELEKEKKRENEEERVSSLMNRTNTRICNMLRTDADATDVATCGGGGGEVPAAGTSSLSSSSNSNSNSNDGEPKRLNMSILSDNDTINSTTFNTHTYDTPTPTVEYDIDDTEHDILTSCMGQQQRLLLPSTSTTNVGDKIRTRLQRSAPREGAVMFHHSTYEDNGNYDVHAEKIEARGGGNRRGQQMMMMKMLMMPSSPLSPLSSHDASVSCSGGSGGDGDGGEGEGEDDESEAVEWTGTRWMGTVTGTPV